MINRNPRMDPNQALLGAYNSVLNAFDVNLGGGDAREVIIRTAGVTTGSYQSDAIINEGNWRGAYFTVDIISSPASGTLQFFVDKYDLASDNFAAIMQAGAEPTGLHVSRDYLMYPGAVDTDTLLDHLTQLPLPRAYRLRILSSDPNGAWGYSVGVTYLD